MTLADWLDTWPYRATFHAGGSVSIPDDFTASYAYNRRAAFRLSDYIVTASSGGSLWFVPRRGEST